MGLLSLLKNPPTQHKHLTGRDIEWHLDKRTDAAARGVLIGRNRRYDGIIRRLAQCGTCRNDYSAYQDSMK